MSEGKNCTGLWYKIMVQTSLKQCQRSCKIWNGSACSLCSQIDLCVAEVLVTHNGCQVQLCSEIDCFWQRRNIFRMPAKPTSNSNFIKIWLTSLYTLFVAKRYHTIWFTRTELLVRSQVMKLVDFGHKKGFVQALVTKV